MRNGWVYPYIYINLVDEQCNVSFAVRMVIIDMIELTRCTNMAMSSLI